MNGLELTSKMNQTTCVKLLIDITPPDLARSGMRTISKIKTRSVNEATIINVIKPGGK